MSDILVKTNDLPWVPLAEGIDYRVLRTSPETGTDGFAARPSRLLFCQTQAFGAGEYFMIKGRMEYRAGCAVAGDYGYEPLDAVHEETKFTEYSELYFTNHGPVVFLDDNDNVTSILDHSVITQLAAAHESDARSAQQQNKGTRQTRRLFVLFAHRDRSRQQDRGQFPLAVGFHDNHCGFGLRNDFVRGVQTRGIRCARLQSVAVVNDFCLIDNRAFPASLFDHVEIYVFRQEL